MLNRIPVECFGLQLLVVFRSCGAKTHSSTRQANDPQSSLLAGLVIRSANLEGVWSLLGTARMFSVSDLASTTYAAATGFSKLALIMTLVRYVEIRILSRLLRSPCTRHNLLLGDCKQDCSK